LIDIIDYLLNKKIKLMDSSDEEKPVDLPPIRLRCSELNQK
jgi:hypothetical protein